MTTDKSQEISHIYDQETVHTPNVYKRRSNMEHESKRIDSENVLFSKLKLSENKKENTQ